MIKLLFIKKIRAESFLLTDVRDLQSRMRNMAAFSGILFEGRRCNRRSKEN